MLSPVYIGADGALLMMCGVVCVLDAICSYIVKSAMYVARAREWSG